MNAFISNSQALPKSKSGLERMLEQVDTWIENQSVCHYFCIQLKGQEVHPFGSLNRPFYDYEQANRKLESLKVENSDFNYYISVGAFDSSALNFDDEDAPMWEREWLNKHFHRLTLLRYEAMNEKQLTQEIPEYESLMKWEKKNNIKEHCHYYYAQSEKNDNQDICITSGWTMSFIEALAAKKALEKEQPKRVFKIIAGVMFTEELMRIDGQTVDYFQEFIDSHKERIASLNGGQQDA